MVEMMIQDKLGRQLCLGIPRGRNSIYVWGQSLLDGTMVAEARAELGRGANEYFVLSGEAISLFIEQGQVNR